MKKCSLHFAGITIALSFLCTVPLITKAQQTGTTAQVNKEKNSGDLEEEDESLETEMKHRRSVWYKAMQKKKPDYFEVKKLFENYFRKNPNEKSKPKQICADWLKTQIFYLDKKNRVVAPPPVNYNAIKKLSFVPWATVTDTMAGTWHMTGPRNAYQTSYSGIGNRGGYVSSARIDPNNSSKLFIGFTTGGLWVSNDGGAVWQLTDKNLPDREYIDIDICKANSNYVYAISRGNAGAVIKSTDGGLTWASTALNSTNYPGVNAYDIAVSPTNQNIVVARWGTTIYRTTDGGTTWNSILTGLKNYSVWGGTNINAEVLDFHATDNNVVYHLDRNDNQNYVTLYRSSDAGASFSNLGNINIPAGAVGNIVGWSKLLTATNNADAVYVAMGTGASAYGHRSVHMFKLNPTTGAILQTRVEMVPEAQGVHHGDIAMDINNENLIVYGDYGDNKTFYSTDNGATFTQSVTSVHSDLRALSVINGNVLLGTDGEACYSTDNGANYTSLTAAVSNHELWGFGAAHKTDVLGAGTNHGPLMIREHEGPQGWYNAMGADQGNSDVNPLDDKYLYSQGYSSYHVVRTGVHTMTSGAGGQEIDPGGIYAYFNTMHFHPNLYYTFITHHAGQYPTGNPNLATWKNSLIRSDNNGVTITKVIKTFASQVFREDICMTDTNRIYVVEALTNNKLWKTIDGGTTWTEITPSTAVTGTGVRNISDISVSDVNPNEIWISYSGVQNTCKVLHSTDGGVTYTNLTSAVLTTSPITKMIFQRGTNGGVYVGNKSGVFYRNNSMADWQLIGNGLPMVDVRFMFINYFKGKLMIGTSRGAWDHDLYETTAPKAQISASKNKVVCSGSVRFADYSVLHKDAQTSYSWSFPGGTPSTSTLENPVVNYSTAGTFNVTLTVTDQYGTSTQTLANFINVDCSAYADCGNPLDIPSENMSIVYFDSQETISENGAAANAIDGNNSTIWHTKYSGGTDQYPHELQVDLGRIYSVSKFKYLPRQSGTNGYVANYEIYVSNNIANWGTAVASGTFANNATEKVVSFAAKSGRYVRFKALSAANGAAYASAAEIKVTGCVLPNVAPTTSITSPANNASFNTPVNVTINADAADSDGSVTKVEFFQGSNLLGEDLIAPYSFTWNNVATGSYAITAKATDNEGAITTSAVVNIIVTNPAPTCTNGYEPNETRTTAALISMNTEIKTQIASAIDVDYYKFVPSVSGNATIQLTTLPADYDLYLYKSNGSQFGSSTNGGTTNESIVKSLTAGTTYYIRVIGYGGVYSTTSCYTLNARTGTFARMGSPTESSAKQDKKVFEVFPVPAKNVLNINLAGFDGVTVVRLFDMQGRMVLQENLVNGHNELNIKKLTAGVYVIKAKNNEEERSIKVIKE
jgi:photosystem II stability/assembly factor-like uncharacterized protein